VGDRKREDVERVFPVQQCLRSGEFLLNPFRRGFLREVHAQFAGHPQSGSNRLFRLIFGSITQNEQTIEPRSFKGRVRLFK
jgi:hypothetical protein